MLYCLLALLLARPAAAAPCAPWLVRVITAQGSVETRANAGGWSAAESGLTICRAVTLRVGGAGRAVLELPNQTYLRAGPRSVLVIAGRAGDAVPTLQVRAGSAYFLSRTPQQFDVRTPFLNASIEGTEFQLETDRSASVLSVYEGQVRATSAEHSERVAGGEQLRATADGDVQRSVLTGPREGLAWALYYPWLADMASDPALEPAREQALAGHPDRALALLPDPLDARGRLLRAHLALAAGQPARARADLQPLAQAVDAGIRAQALALASLMALNEGQPERAAALEGRALAVDDASSAVWLVRSYRLQHSFQTEAARDAARTALELQPQSLVGRLRVAEIELALGNLGEARRLLASDADAPPLLLARAERTRAFAALLDDDAWAAQRLFERASMLEPGDPLARLGRGLALTRRGRGEAGRRQMEIAALLDPGHALIRSYLGKAYASQGEHRGAAAELERARALDPADPTPWLYDALRLLAQNRPAEALASLEASIARNDNRAAYRSRLLLDEDLAARQISQARVYEALGFEQAARTRAAQSLALDPTNDSAHRFLADSYTRLPRHEVGRLSELLQAQLWQPLNVQPLQPQAVAEALSLRQPEVSLASGLGEYGQLFVEDGARLYASGFGGRDGIAGNNLMLSMLGGPLAITVSQFHYERDGFRDNNDQQIDLYNIFAQWRVSADTSIQAEIREQESERGDLPLYFYDDAFSDSVRLRERLRTARLGLRHRWNAATSTLVSLQVQDVDASFSEAPAPGITSAISDTGTPKLVEVQQHLRTRWGEALVGASYYRFKNRIDARLMTPVFSFDDLSVVNVRQRAAHAYGFVNGPRGSVWTLGLSSDRIEGEIESQTYVNPKIGVVWPLGERTLLRAAAFKAVSRELIGQGTIEPAQVAGFVQFFDDLTGTRSKRYGLGIDHRPAPGWHLGAEASFRELRSPIIEFSPFAPPQTVYTKGREWLHRAFAYWTPHPRWALRTGYEYEELDREGIEIATLAANGTFAILELTTQRVPVGVRFSHPTGFSLDVEHSYHHQRGRFERTHLGLRESGKDSFWITDLLLAYRLPHNLGQISLGVYNLFDTSFRFQDSDPELPMLYPDRLALGRLTLVY